jgi:8-hydroxy-5-deazaflavin:NADPH oxidoreductase
MKIALIGSGHIGEGLGRAWGKHGHHIVYGARDTADPELTALCQKIGATAASVSDAARDAEVVVMAVPWAALDDVLGAIGDLSGKVVIDCMNAVERPAVVLHFGRTTSWSEEMQKRVPGARVVKSFNAQGAETLANPVYDGVCAANFYCGDDADAKRIVKGLIEEIGFEPIDAGALKSARLLEPLMLLWLASSQALGTRDLAFHLLRR